MKTSNKLTKLSQEDGILKGGFASLTMSQICKIKGGGSGDGNSNCTCYGDNCKCFGNINCPCHGNNCYCQ